MHKRAVFGLYAGQRRDHLQAGRRFLRRGCGKAEKGRLRNAQRHVRGLKEKGRGRDRRGRHSAPGYEPHQPRIRQYHPRVHGAFRRCVERGVRVHPHGQQRPTGG